MALMVNECQFDLRTVSEYLEREGSENRSILEDDPEDNFQGYVRMNSRHRVESLYKTLFEALLDAEKMKAQEK